MPAGFGIDIVLALGALATLYSLVRSRSFWDDEFTAADRHLATQVSVFLIPPVVVLLHEVGHALATWSVGARVVAFHYGLFEGSVTSEGFTTAAQLWWVAISGNLVSIAVGLLLLAAGARASGLRRPLRYLMIMGGVVELVASLVLYPVMSLSPSSGDWVVIYDFSRTPVLSSVTLVLQVLVLVGLWRWWRGRLRETLFAIAYGEEERVTALERSIAENPAGGGPYIELANLFAGHGDLGLAAATLDRAVRRCGHDARLHLARARLALHRGQWNQAMLAARAGLDVPSADDELRQRLWANEGLALAQMNRPGNALSAFEHVTGPVNDDLRVRYGRGVARLASGDADGGRSDMQAVVDRLPPGDTLRGWAETCLQGEAPPTAPMAGV